MKTLTQLCLILFFISVSAANATVFTANVDSDVTLADANRILREAIVTNTSGISEICQATKGNTLSKIMKYTCEADTVVITYKDGLLGDSLMLQRSFDLTNWSNLYAIQLSDPAEFKDVISDTAYYRIITFSNGTFDSAECKDTSDVIRGEPDRAVVAGSLEIIEGSATLCPGDKSTLQVTGSNGDIIKWYVFPAGGTFIETGITGNTIEVSYESNSPLIRSYLAESIIGECKAITGFQPFSNLNVVPGTINGPSEICNDQTITMSLENHIGDIQWQRNTGSIWEDLPGETEASISYNPSLAKVTVQFRAVLSSVAAACIATTELHAVTSDTCIITPKVDIPNALTPNGDLINDVFYVENILDYPNNQLIIYNRWGNKVFETRGYKNDWNGVDEQGQPLPVATYYYVLELGPDTFGNMSEENKFNGSVSILR